MKRTSTLLVCSLVALTAAKTAAQNPGFWDMNDEPRGQIARLTQGIRPGLYLRWDTIAEPALEKHGNIMVFGRTDGNLTHRITVVEQRKQYFGYDMSVDIVGEGKYRVQFFPLSIQPLDIVKEKVGPVTAVLPSKYPEPQYVESGDKIALDLFVSADRSQKIVDYIWFSSQGRPQTEPPVPTSIGEPKDFTVDDGPVKLAQAGLWIDDQKFANYTFGNGPNEGATIWLYVPGQGRFILSLVPHEEFQKIGVIRDNVISLPVDGQQYEIRAYSPIVEGGGAWNLYVLHDRFFQWTPANKLPPGTPFIGLGVARLANLLRK
jgi:hypothetical protein